MKQPSVRISGFFATKIGPSFNDGGGNVAVGQEKSQGKTYWASTRDENGCFGKVGSSGIGSIRSHRSALEKRKSVDHRTTNHCGMVYHWEQTYSCYKNQKVSRWVCECRISDNLMSRNETFLESEI